MKRQKIVSEFAARSKFAKNSEARTEVEKEVVKCYGVLEIAELSFSPGRDFGHAVKRLRDEIKKNGTRNFMARLKELGISQAKARYWIAIVDNTPINRGKSKNDAQQNGAAQRSTKEQPMDWREEWDGATDRFRQISHVIVRLSQSKPEGRGPLIAELENLAVFLGYDLKKKVEGE